MPINYKEYPPDWKEIRTRILQRACNRCEKCGLSNYALINKKDRSYALPIQMQRYSYLLTRDYSPSQAIKQLGLTKIVLTIAHVDNDHSNHGVTDDRLLALCQRCHLKMDISHHVENRKYGRKYRENNYKLF